MTESPTDHRSRLSVSRSIGVAFAVVLFSCTDVTIDPSSLKTSFTAAQRLPAINAYVKDLYPGAQFLRARCPNVDSCGRAYQWFYDFADTSMSATSYYLHATSAKIVLDSIGAFPLGISVITTPWFDSDSAMLFA